MSRRGRVWLTGAALVVALFAAGLAGLILFYPVDSLRAPLERKISEASGYRVSLGRLRLRLAGLGISLQAGDVSAESPDGGQTIEVPEMGLDVALLPLLRREVKVRRVRISGLVLEMKPPVRGGAVGSGAGGDAGGGGAAGAGASPGTPPPVTGIIVPEVELTNGRIIQHGSGGTTTLTGVGLRGSFRAGAGGGRFEGVFSADSTHWAPAASPAQPVRLPRIEARFGTDMRFRPASATTELDGRLGDWPVKGRVESTQPPGSREWKNAGRFEMAPVTLDALKSFLSGPAAVQFKDYDLAGRLDGGQLSFETFPGTERLDYEFSTRWSGAKASLPGKGPVVTDGNGTLALRPDDLRLAGTLALGRARLDLDARVEQFAAPRWQAHLLLKGPVAEFLRFLPPDTTLTVTAGAIDLDLDLAGRAGEKTPPRATGTARLEGLAFRQAALAVPVERLDLAATLAGDGARIDDGSIRAGRSDARFRGKVNDLRKPALELSVTAGTVDLDELFPARPAAPPPRGKSAAQPAAAIPVSGDITIDRLVREKVTLTNLSARFAATSAGLSLTNAVGEAYGGRVMGSMTVTPSGPGAIDYNAQLAVTEASAAELLAAVTPIRGIEGRIRTNVQISGRNGPGLNPLSTLSLAGGGVVLDGALVNVPVVAGIARALQLKDAAADRIPFRTLRHRLRVENGFVQLDTLSLGQTAADWMIGGRIGLDGRLDCPITARLDKSLFAAGGDLKILADALAGPDGRIAVQLFLKGTLAKPEVSVNLDLLVEAARKKAAGTVTEELKKRLGRILKKD